MWSQILQYLPTDANSAFDRLCAALERDGLVEIQQALPEQLLLPQEPAPQGEPLAAVDENMAQIAPPPAIQAPELAQVAAAPVPLPNPQNHDDEDDLIIIGETIRNNQPANNENVAPNVNAAPAFELKCTNRKGRCEIGNYEDAVQHLTWLLAQNDVVGVDISKCVANLIKCFGCTVQDKVLVKGFELLRKLKLVNISRPAAETVIQVAMRLAEGADDEWRVRLLSIATKLCEKPGASAFMTVARTHVVDVEKYPVSKVMVMLETFVTSQNRQGAIAALSLVDALTEIPDGLNNFIERAANYDCMSDALKLEDEDFLVRYHVVRIFGGACYEDIVAKQRCLDLLPTLFDISEAAAAKMLYGVTDAVMGLFACKGFLDLARDNNKLPPNHVARLTTMLQELELHQQAFGCKTDWMDNIKTFLGMQTRAESEAAKLAEKKAERAEENRRRREERRQSARAVAGDGAANGLGGIGFAVGDTFFTPLEDWYKQQPGIKPPAIDVSKYMTQAKIVERRANGYYACRYEPFVDIWVVLDPRDKNASRLEVFMDGTVLNEYEMVLPVDGMHWHNLPDGFELVNSREKLWAIEEKAWPEAHKIRQKKLSDLRRMEEEDEDESKPRRSRGKKRKSDELAE